MSASAGASLAALSPTPREWKKPLWFPGDEKNRATEFQSTHHIVILRRTHLSGLRTPFLTITCLWLVFCPSHFGVLDTLSGNIDGRGLSIPWTSEPGPDHTSYTPVDWNPCKVKLGDVLAGQSPSQQKMPFGSKYETPKIPLFNMGLHTDTTFFAETSSRVWQVQCWFAFPFLLKTKGNIRKGRGYSISPRTVDWCLPLTK